MVKEILWESSNENLDYDKISWNFTSYESTEALDEIDANNNLLRVKDIIQDRHIEPYCDCLDNIIVLGSDIYRVDLANFDSWSSNRNLRFMLKKWNVKWECIWKFVNDEPIFFEDISNIMSNPFDRSSRWTTLCSQTAWKNAQMFWLKVPRWKTAKQSLSMPPLDNRFLKTIKREGGQYLTLKSLSSVAFANFADLQVWSKSGNWHRAEAFKDTNWNRYVMDPYVSPYEENDDRNQVPQPLTSYYLCNRIIKANLYLAPIQAKMTELHPKAFTGPIQINS